MESWLPLERLDGEAFALDVLGVKTPTTGVALCRWFQQCAARIVGHAS